MAYSPSGSSPCSSPTRAKAKTRFRPPPNIILFLVDDLGWQDHSVRFHDDRTVWNDLYQTPNLERLAARGMVFTDAYASSPVCSPTRTSILTGRCPARTRITNWTLRINKRDGNARLRCPEWNSAGLQPGDGNLTLATILASAGYRTAHVGKAHVGAQDDGTGNPTPGADPRNLGFDINVGGSGWGQPGSYSGRDRFINPGGRHQVPHLEAYHDTDTYLTDALTLEALKIIDRAVADEAPLFLALSPFAVHTPIQGDARWKQPYLDRNMPDVEARYATMIESVDRSLGAVLDRLETRGIAKHTIVIFSSDNGALSAHTRSDRGFPWVRHAHNTPLRSGKGSAYEGGLRVPLIISWPNVVAPGTRCDEPVVSHDLFPTLLAMARVPRTEAVLDEIDGEDLTDLLNQSGHFNRKGALTWHYPHQWGAPGPGIGPFTAIRDGKWKLIYFYDDRTWELYDLKRDIGETVNRAETDSEIARRLATSLVSWMKSIGAQLPISKATGMAAPLPSFAPTRARPVVFRSEFPQRVERPWIGPDYWTNPLQDWRLANGRIECFRSGGDRNVHLLTRDVTDRPGEFEIEVRLGRLDPQEKTGQGWVGFRLGAKGEFQDYRDSAVYGRGLNAGLTTGGKLFIGSVEQNTRPIASSLDDIRLSFVATSGPNGYRGQLRALNKEGEVLGEIFGNDIPGETLVGNVAIVCSVCEFKPQENGTQKVSMNTRRRGSVRFWFKDWTMRGTKVATHPERAYGPIFFAQHTLSRGILKITAQMAPLGNHDDQRVRFQVRKDGKWKTLATPSIDPLSFTATVRREGWEDREDTPYRFQYSLQPKDGTSGTHSFSGTVRRNPVDQDQLVIAAFTGNNDLGFPHKDLVENVRHFDPDLLVFTGDPIYEGVGGYGIERRPLDIACLDYLRKWLLFGWEFGDLLREIPVINLPDDHDVYQGNIWGCGGRAAPNQDAGGYTGIPQWVNVVQRTQTSHHPDPFDPRPADQSIGVYYGPLNYGGLSVAVVEDRKWKSAPKEWLPSAEIRNGWAQSRGYNASRDGDVPGAVLLGNRQLDFLEHWAADWSHGAWMKIVVSQTLFANLATLPVDARSGAVTPSLKILAPGEYAKGELPVQDHDSNGWPQAGRNRALRTLRKGFAFHLAGDQHLGSTIQYGIDAPGDAGFALCVPSIANFWPRRWFPPAPGSNHRDGMPPYSGDYRDGFGNFMTVHAVSNPHLVSVPPYRLHNRAPGYGIVTIHRETRRLTIANWPRWVDPSKEGARPYPGWPIEIEQMANFRPRNAKTLPEIRVEGIESPVLQVINSMNREIVWTIRMPPSRRLTPHVPQDGIFHLKIFDTATSRCEWARGLRTGVNQEPITIRFTQK